MENLKMRNGTSLYLDLVRFGAAMIVFIDHLRFHTRRGFGTFWNAHPFVSRHLEPYSQIAVIIFFVLSGYVIAHVLATRERTPLEYTTRRLARLYSIIVPALLLTAACNLLITLRYPDAMGGSGSAMVNYVGMALFMNALWFLPHFDVPNTPFWTLDYEATYYVAIALILFVRGWGRIVALLAVTLLTGLSMIVLAPTWFLGYVAYHVSAHRRLAPVLAILLWLTSLILLPLCAWLELNGRLHLGFLRTPDHTVGFVLTAYAAAICFTVNLLTFDAFSNRVQPLLAPFAAFIRWVGSLTFALYLFHQPLLSLFTVYHMPDRSSLSQLVLLVGGTFGVVATLGRFCENSKGAYRRFFLAAWSSPSRRSGLKPTPVTVPGEAGAIPELDREPTSRSIQ